MVFQAKIKVHVLDILLDERAHACDQDTGIPYRVHHALTAQVITMVGLIRKSSDRLVSHMVLWTQNEYMALSIPLQDKDQDPQDTGGPSLLQQGCEKQALKSGLEKVTDASGNKHVDSMTEVTIYHISGYSQKRGLFPG